MDNKEATLEEKYNTLLKKYHNLSENEELYRTAFGLTNHTVTIVDVKKKALCQIFNEGSWEGVQTTMENAPESIINLGIVYPDDIEGYRSFYKEIYAGVPKSNCDIRVKSEDGHWHWFSMYSEMMFGENGEPLYAVCFSDDLTSQHEAELMYQQFVAILKSGSQYAWEVNLSKDMMLSSNSESGENIIKNPFAKSYTDVHEKGAECVVINDRQKFKDLFNRLSLLQSFYEGKRELNYTYQYEIPHTNKVVWLESTVYLVMNGVGDVNAIVVSDSVSHQKQKELQLERRATLDPLCGIMNKETFEKCALMDMTTSTCGVLFMLDVDNFKGINDTFGHLFGDKVLVSIANIVKGNFRKNDLVARYGGDEFVMFLSGKLNEKVVMAAADTLLKKLSQVKFDNEYVISVSLGSALWNGKDSLKELFKKADAALYSSKKTGKGKHSFFKGDQI